MVPPDQSRIVRHFPGGREATFVPHFLPELPIEAALCRAATGQPSHPHFAHKERVAEKAYPDNAPSQEVVEMFGLKTEGLSDCPPHGGFAIGLERLTQKILGLANVKEACLFPRDRRRVRS